jgi:nucleoside-diphosphate-sugar epimerase
VLTFVHVRDVAEAILRTLERDGCGVERYLLGNDQLCYRDLDRLITDLRGVPSSATSLPLCLVNAIASFLTGATVRFGGSKAVRELGITYTPIRDALEDAIAYHLGGFIRIRPGDVPESRSADGVWVNCRSSLRVMESVPSYDD